MKKTLDDLTGELATIRTGRASVHLLDNVMVEYYGSQTPLNQLATLHAPEPSLITVQPWDVSQIESVRLLVDCVEQGLIDFTQPLVPHVIGLHTGNQALDAFLL